MGSMGPIERHRIFLHKTDVRSIADGKIDKTIDAVLYSFERYRHPAIRSQYDWFSNKVLDHTFSSICAGLRFR
jgi:hypothetical protein